MPHCKTFIWKHIKNGSRNSYFGNKEQKTSFLIDSLSDVHFGFKLSSRTQGDKLYEGKYISKFIY